MTLRPADGPIHHIANRTWIFLVLGRKKAWQCFDRWTRCGDRPSRLREAYLRLTTSATRYTAARGGSRDGRTRACNLRNGIQIRRIP